MTTTTLMTLPTSVQVFRSETFIFVCFGFIYVLFMEIYFSSCGQVYTSCPCVLCALISLLRVRHSYDIITLWLMAVLSNAMTSERLRVGEQSRNF